MPACTKGDNTHPNVLARGRASGDVPPLSPPARGGSPARRSPPRYLALPACGFSRRPIRAHRVSPREWLLCSLTEHAVAGVCPIVPMERQAGRMFSCFDCRLTVLLCRVSPTCSSTWCARAGPAQTSVSRARPGSPLACRRHRGPEPKWGDALRRTRTGSEKTSKFGTGVGTRHATQLTTHLLSCRCVRINTYNASSLCQLAQSRTL